MAQFKKKIVLITGASSGIGMACADSFGKAGARLILAARRADRLRAKAADLKNRFGTECLTIPLDVRDRRAVEKSLSSLPQSWRDVEVLLNNAGLSRGLHKLHEGSPVDWDEMIDTNVKGLLYVTRTILPGMVERGRGHVINIGSIAGREVYPSGNAYCASKFAVKAITRGLRMDLLGTPVRVSTIDPGMVETEFSLVRFRGDEERAAKVYEGLKPLAPQDIAEAVLWVASRPPHVDVSQASATMAHRKV